MNLDDLQRQTIHHYASTGKVHCRKLLSTTLTFNPVTLKMTSV